jgi:hypothetical protein
VDGISSDGTTKGKHRSDAEFVALYAQYIWRTSWMDAFYFPLDVPADDRRMLLQSLMEFCEIERDMDLVDSFKWNPVGESKRDRFLSIPEHMVEPLEFAREWYEHYTIHWGAKYRHANNTISEGR